MHIDNQRLLSALQETVDGLAAIADSPQGKTFQGAATTILCELSRRENLPKLDENFRQGLACGKALLAAITSAGKSAGEAATRLSALPPQLENGLDIETG